MILEDIEDKEILLQQCITDQGNSNEYPLFTLRPEKGIFVVLINRHLINDDKKFREIFRLNNNKFNYVLDCINSLIWLPFL